MPDEIRRESGYVAAEAAPTEDQRRQTRLLSTGSGAAATSLVGLTLGHCRAPKGSQRQRLQVAGKEDAFFILR